MEDHQSQPEIKTISCKLYPHGKCYGFTEGPDEFSDIVEDCLSSSLRVEVRLDKKRFHHLMKSNGIPEELIQQFLARASVMDEIYLNPWA